MDQHESNFLQERRCTVQPVTDVRFIRLKEVLATCGMSRSSIYEAIKEGEFPAPIKLRGRSSAWIKSEVLQWVQSCIDASRPK